MRLGYLTFLLILVLVAVGAWYLSSKSPASVVAPAITTSTPSETSTTQPAP